VACLYKNEQTSWISKQDEELSSGAAKELKNSVK
jgi:hypothetical protein